MIERLLEAERARLAGDLDLAELLLRQVVEADPRNAIAVVGLAKVSLDRGDIMAAEAHAQQALEIDPDEAAARRILDELVREGPEPESEPERALEAEAADTPAAERPVAEPPSAEPPTAEPPAAEPASPSPRSWLRRLIDRLLGRNLPS